MRERKHLPNDTPEYSRQHETKKKLFWLQTEILVQRQKFFAWIYDPWSTSSYLLEKRKSASLMRDMVNNIQAEGEGGCTVSTLVNVLSKSALSGYYRPPPLPVVNYRNSTVGSARFFHGVAHVLPTANSLLFFSSFPLYTTPCKCLEEAKPERASIPGQ